MPAPPLVLAHRGASHRAPENTLEAFALARTLGADGVELDVRRSADGVLVVHHDPEARGTGLLAAARFAEIRAARPDIPTLDEALEACAGLVVNVEVKCLPWEPDPDEGHHVARAAADAVRGIPRAVLSSFDAGAIAAVRAHAPEVETGWLTMGRPVAELVEPAAAAGHAWLHPDRVAALAAGGEGVAACHAAGLRVDVWTVDDPGEIRALAAAGVDAVITNTPDAARAALTAP